jgi:predicted DNA-binding transcriptional regulator YafY
MATSSPYVKSRMVVSDTRDAEGWKTVTIPIGSSRHAATELLRLGPDAEVVEPPELRATIMALVDGLGRRYDRIDLTRGASVSGRCT